MRIAMRVFVATVAMLPIGVVAVQHASAVTDPGTDCAHTTGAATFNPGLAKFGSPESSEKAQTVTVTGAKVTSCVGGGVTSGTASATIHINDPGNCQSLASSDGPPTPANTGTFTIKWNNGKTSTVTALSLKAVSGQPTQQDVSGPVTNTSTQFKGLPLTVRISFTPSNGDCVHSDLKAVTFKEVAPGLEIG